MFTVASFSFSQPYIPLPKPLKHNPQHLRPDLFSGGFRLWRGRLRWPKESPVDGDGGFMGL